MCKCKVCITKCADEFEIKGLGIVCENCSYNFAAHLIKIKTVNIELTTSEIKILNKVLLDEIVKQNLCCSKMEVETLIRIFYKVKNSF